MGHSKIYKNESEFIIANVMDDVENVDAREYFINFHAKIEHECFIRHDYEKTLIASTSKKHLV